MNKLLLFLKPTLFTLIVAAAVTTACKGSGPSKADLEGKAYAVGDKVEGKYKGSEKVRKGKIKSLYGPAALVDFSSGRRHWTDLKDLEPKGAYLAPGKEDKCEFEKGDRVKARRSKSGRTMSGKRMSSMHKGKLLKVYGKIGHVEFKDGLDWAYCSEMEKDDSKEEDEVATTTKKKSTGPTQKGNQCRSRCATKCKGGKGAHKCRKQCKAACPK